jgi:hypothetical protein
VECGDVRSYCGTEDDLVTRIVAEGRAARRAVRSRCFVGARSCGRRADGRLVAAIRDDRLIRPRSNGHMAQERPGQTTTAGVAGAG